MLKANSNLKFRYALPAQNVHFSSHIHGIDLHYIHTLPVLRDVIHDEVIGWNMGEVLRDELLLILHTSPLGIYIKESVTLYRRDI